MFRDRSDAGRALAAALRAEAARRPLVLGLPRGGVPVAAEVAAALGAELDVLVVRKLGVPYQEEVAMGAIASGGVRVLLPSVIAAAGATSADVEAVAAREAVELERRERAYREGRAPLNVAGRTVIVVDDGVATGATMLAALRALRAMGAARVVLAAPVCARESQATLAADADAVVVLQVPAPFLSVGAAYRDFAQTTDEEVRALLAARR